MKHYALLLFSALLGLATNVARAESTPHFFGIAAATAIGQAPVPKRSLSEIINQDLETLWEKTGIVPSKSVGDETFLRRAYLVMTGRPPRYEELLAYTKEGKKAGRSNLCRSLAESPETSAFLAKNMAEWLTRADVSNRVSRVAALAKLIEPELQKDTPYDAIVGKILPSDEFRDANRIRNDDVDDATEENKAVRHYELASQIFNGRQVQCARCHDQPDLTRAKTMSADHLVTQAEYAALRAFWLGSKIGQGVSRVGESVIAEPAWNGVALKDPANRKSELAKVLATSPYFAKAAVNRMWGLFFGSGLTSGHVDDFSLATELKYPRLLEDLAKQFREGHSLRELMVGICSSRPFSLSGEANVTNDGVSKENQPEHHFSRYIARQQQREQLVNSFLIGMGHDPKENVSWESKRFRDDGSFSTFKETAVRRDAYTTLIEPNENHGKLEENSISTRAILPLMNSEVFHKDIMSSPTLETLVGNPAEFRVTIARLYHMMLGERVTLPNAAEMAAFNEEVRRAAESSSYRPQRWQAAVLTEAEVRNLMTRQRNPLTRAQAEAEVLEDTMWAILQSGPFQMIH